MCVGSSGCVAGATGGAQGSRSEACTGVISGVTPPRLAAWTFCRLRVETPPCARYDVACRDVAKGSRPAEVTPLGVDDACCNIANYNAHGVCMASPMMRL